MTWQNVPWFIGVDGVVHPAEVQRLLAYAATGSVQGIVGPGDCEVRESAVPDSNVRVMPGAVVALNRNTGGGQQSYMARNPTEDVVPIAATSSVGGRTDLIYAEIIDPTYPGNEAVPAGGPYVRTGVIENVSTSVRTLADVDATKTGVALALVTLPASTGTVQQSMVTDLRQLAQTRQERHFNVIAPSARDNLTGANYHNWPDEAQMDVDVPEWATHCRLRVFIAGVVFGGNGDNGGAGWNVFGETRIQFGGGSADTYSQGTAWNVSNEGGHDRFTIMAGAPKLAIDPANRGKTATVRVESELRSATAGAEVYVQGGAMISLDIEFLTAAESGQ